MKFSIVTSFYNEPLELIENVCNSVLSQTYTNFEWIITEDFSENQELVNLVKSLPQRDRRIKYVEQKSKKEIWWDPQTYAIGDVVVVVDGDDQIYPKTLEVYNYFYNKYPDVLFMTTELKNIRNGNYAGALYINYSNYKNHLDQCNYKTHDKTILPHVRNEVFSHGYNRSWRNININFKENNDNNVIFNDYSQLVKLEEYGKLLHIPRALYEYTYRTQSISRLIDENNNYMYDSYTFMNDIKNRRGDKNIKSIKRIFDDIYIESNAFLDSNLSHEKTSKNILFITPETLKLSKQEAIEELYFEHNLYFNDYRDDIDYCIVQFNSYKQKDAFFDIYNNIKKYIGKAEVIIQITYKENLPENNLFLEFLNFLKPFHCLYYFDYNNIYATIKIY